MADTVEATIRDTATIEVECESCGHEFSYEQVFLAKADVHRANPQLDGMRAIRNLGDQLRSGFGKGDYSKISWHRCPNCGYTQSWMLKRARITHWTRIVLPIVVVLVFGSVIAAIIIPNPILGGELLKYSLLAAVVVPVVSFIITTLVFRPNRGRGVGETKVPNITFAAEAHAREDYLRVGNMPGDMPQV